MIKIIWIAVFLIILSLPNIVALWFDPSTTKLASLLIPILLFVGLGRLVPSYKKRTLWALPFIIFSFISLCILIQFNLQITEGVLEAVINSDVIEGYEFMREVKPVLYWLFILYIISFLYLYVYANKLESCSPSTKVRLWITVLFIALPIIDVSGKGASARSYPLIIAKTSYEYAVESALMQEMLDQRKDFSFNAKTTQVSKDETFILVIGETSRRDYYSLYGYYRQTNPRLSKLDGLVVFKDAISPANATVSSLMSILHLSTAEDKSLFYTTKSIVSLAKEAGYKTWWISAQSRFGKHETSVSSSGIESDVKVFIEGGRNLLRNHDEALLPFAGNSLADPADQKFVVMHLYGSHISYNKRYSKDFSLFKEVPRGYENHSIETQNKVNEYANSIAYTDFVLAELIKKADEKNKSTCVVYIADHGEYLAEDAGDDFIGHGGAEPHKVEVEVPLIVWCSEEYRQKNPTKWAEIINNKDQPISLEDMFYSLSDLMHIDYDLVKPKRSFFNAKYTPKLPRKMRSSSTGKIFNYQSLK